MSEKLLNVKQVAEKLNVKESTVRSFVFQNRIPVVRPGGRLVRFDPEEIDRWLRAGRSRCVLR